MHERLNMTRRSFTFTAAPLQEAHKNTFISMATLHCNLAPHGNTHASLHMHQTPWSVFQDKRRFKAPSDAHQDLQTQLFHRRPACSEAKDMSGKTSMDRSTQATLSIYNTLIYVSHLQSIYHSTAGKQAPAFEGHRACHGITNEHHHETMTSSTRISSKDSGLEAFSHNPTGCTIAAIIYQIAAFTRYLKEVFLSC